MLSSEKLTAYYFILRQACLSGRQAQDDNYILPTAYCLNAIYS